MPPEGLLPIRNSMKTGFDRAAEEIIRAGNRLDTLGLAPATAGNYSMRLESGEIAITVSGAHKGTLEKKDIMRVDAQGNALEDKKPSAETLLHTLLYAMFPHVQAILHSHSIPCVVLTRLFPKEKFMTVQGYELQKVFLGVTSHETQVMLPVFDNSQDMTVLSAQVQEVLRDRPETPAYLIRGHGLYGWGRTMKEAAQVVEGLEVLLSCELEMLKLAKDMKR